jgi:predicted transcriptional regulator
MAQVTWRAPDELVDRVRQAAEAQKRSVNEFLTRLAEAATNPDLADDDATRTRERLARAGLLVPPGPPRPRPDPDAVAAARADAGSGTPLSELVSNGRR